VRGGLAVRCRPEQAVNWRRCLVALVILVRAGCAPSAGGSGQPANAPYPRHQRYALTDLLADRTQGLTDPDDAPEVPEHPVSRTGDLFGKGPTSPLTRARIMRAREDRDEWPADQVERWPIDRLIPYAKNSPAPGSRGAGLARVTVRKVRRAGRCCRQRTRGRFEREAGRAGSAGFGYGTARRTSAAGLSSRKPS
jgi:hypothetical protein